MFFIRHWDSDVSEGQESWAWENDDVKSHSNRYRLKIIFMLPGYLVKCLDIQKSDIFALIRQMRQIVVIYETWTLLIQWRSKSITYIFLLLPKHFLFWSKLWDFLRNPRLTKFEHVVVEIDWKCEILSKNSTKKFYKNMDWEFFEYRI